MTIYWKAVEQYFTVVLLIRLFLHACYFGTFTVLCKKNAKGIRQNLFFVSTEISVSCTKIQVLSGNMLNQEQNFEVILFVLK